MKPELRRLLILDVIVFIACTLRIFNGVSPGMRVPVILAQLTLLGYGLYLFAQKRTGSAEPG